MVSGGCGWMPKPGSFHSETAPACRPARTPPPFRHGCGPSEWHGPCKPRPEIHADFQFMSYLAHITWIQLILIEFGSMLQFVALCAFARERNDCLARRTREKVVDTQAQARKLVEQEVLLRAIQAGPRPRRDSDDEDRMEMRGAAHLVKTAKVKFKQTFGFRAQDS
jgi:hypothetical protein